MSIEAEQELLGSFIANNAALDVCSERLRAEHFSTVDHQDIYEAMLKLRASGGVVSTALLLANLPELKDARQYLAFLLANATAPSAAKDYMAVVIEAWVRRELASELRNKAETLPLYRHPIEKVLKELHEALDKVEDELQATEKAQHIREIAPAVLDDIEQAMKGETKYIHTGIGSLDNIFNGFAPGQVTVIGGGTGIGKSSVLVSLALQCAKHGKKVLAFSLEMSGVDIVKRVLASETNVGYSVMDNGLLEADDFARIFDASREVSELPIIMATKGEINIDKIKAHFRRHHRPNDPVGIVILDYLQLVKSVSEYRGNKNLQVAEVSRQLKLLAMQYDVPVVIMSQFSRDYARDGRKPALHDLRDSGSIEQDADNVLLLYRPENAGFNDLGIIVAKQRRGRRDECLVQFNQTTSKFTS